MKRILYILLFLHMATSGVHADTALTYVYDANGNLIQGDGKYYEYNDANKLVKVRYGDANGLVIAEYLYDYNGQRIKKIENGVATYYIGKHTVTEVSESGTKSTKYYFANNERVAQKDSSGNLTFYHSDHLGGTNAVTDSSGNLVDRTKYYPFGEIRLGGNERFTFTGKEKDQVTDQYYFEARYYNPEFKHFTQADTISPNIYDPQELNRYAYVQNNPVNYTDPTGHSRLGNFLRKLLGIKTVEAPTISSDSSYTNSGNVSNNSTETSINYKFTKYTPGDNKEGKAADVVGSGIEEGECVGYIKDITNWNDKFRKSRMGNASFSDKLGIFNKLRDQKLAYKLGEKNVEVGDTLLINLAGIGHVVGVVDVDGNEFVYTHQNGKNEHRVTSHNDRIKKTDSRIYGFYDTEFVLK